MAVLLVTSVLMNCFVTYICNEIDGDGGKAPRIQLNDGNQIPAIGLSTALYYGSTGTLSPSKRDIELMMPVAIDAGYRMIVSSAGDYNEREVGAGVQSSSVPREDVYYMTSLDSNNYRDVQNALSESLQRLNTSYVDLFYISTPVSFTPDFRSYDDVDYVDTWKEMEKIKRSGLAKSIGIANFNISQIKRLLNNSEIPPAVLYVEVTLNLAQDELIEYCTEKNITVVAMLPLGFSVFDAADYPPPKLNEPILKEIGDKYNKTASQVILKYLIQRGVIPILVTQLTYDYKNNINVFDFELNADEMKTLSKFNTNRRIFRMPFEQDHPYYPFEKTEPLYRPFGDIQPNFD